MMSYPMDSQALLEEFKRLKSDRRSHPEAVQRAWTEFIEAVELEATSKASIVEASGTPPAPQDG